MLTQLLTNVIHIANKLASTSSVHELCRQAVQAGLTELGFDRISIWLIDQEHSLIRGTYGTDEAGALRDESTRSHSWVEQMSELELLDDPHTPVKSEGVSLFNDLREVVGVGECGAAALWNGEEVIGFLYIDNLLSQKPIDEGHWRIFDLFASTLGHLLSLKRAEAAMQSKEVLLDQILEMLPVGIFVLAPEEIITRYNRAAREMWELDPTHIEDWSPEAMWVKDGRPVGKDEWAGRRALRYGESTLNQEIEFRRSDGSLTVLVNSAVPLRNPQGELAGAVVVNQNITETKRREQRLEALTRMGQVLRPLTGRRGVLNVMIKELSRLIPAQGVAIVLFDKDGRLVFEAATGVYSSMQGFVVPEDVPQGNGRDTNASDSSSGNSGIRVYDSDENAGNCIFHDLEVNPRFSCTIPLVSEKASVGALMFGFPTPPDSSVLALIDALAYTCASSIQRGELYDYVTTQADRLDRVMESVNFGLVLLDSQLHVVLRNQHAHEQLKSLSDFVVGEELREIGGHAVGQFLTPHSHQSKMQEIEVDTRCDDVTAMPVGATGTDGGWLLVIHDVTRERAIQSSIQQHQRLAAVGQLAAGIAHDFNNIIAVITLYAQMIQRNPDLPENDQDRLKVIREQAQNASKLIRQIQDFSRQTVIERQRVDLAQLIQSSITLWQRTLPESIHFEFSSELSGAADVFAEASSLQQALTNLAVNARDAMPNGGALKIHLATIAVAENEVPVVMGLKPGRWIAIKVVDNGDGILPEHLPHIFDPFFTTKGIGKGVGLGLAQVYGIIQQHGGFVTAHSVAMQGTTISLYLPAMSDASDKTPEYALNESTTQNGEMILLVEDNDPAREATAALLTMVGYRVLAARDGRQGLDLFTKHRESIRLVLTDMVMPEMGGIELYTHVKAANPDVSVIVMTGYLVQDEGHRPELDGAVEWLQKPFSIKQITATVGRVLAQARTRTGENEHRGDEGREM